MGQNITIFVIISEAGRYWSKNRVFSCPPS